MQILVAGTTQQVEKAMQAAESLRDELVERAILLVPLPLFDKEAQSSQAEVLSVSDSDLK